MKLSVLVEELYKAFNKSKELYANYDPDPEIVTLTNLDEEVCNIKKVEFDYSINKIVIIS